MPGISAVLSHTQIDAPQPRLIQAAHEFEAQLMKELLRPLSNEGGLDGDDSDTGSGGVMADFAAEALGRALSAGGGLGIATGIIHSLSHRATPGRSVSGIGNSAES